MSIVKLRKTVRKQIKARVFGRTLEFGSAMSIVFWIIVIIFVVGTYYMYGPGSGPNGPNEGRTRRVTPVVATVNGQPIRRTDFETRFYLAQRQESSRDITRERYLKTQILDALVDRELLRAAARAEGIKVTRADIAAKKDEIVQEIIDRQYAGPAVLRRVLKERNISLEQFKRELRNDPDRMPSDDEIRESLLFEKLEAHIKDAVQVTEAEAKDSFREVRARHILISPDRILEESRAKQAQAQPQASQGAGAEGAAQQPKPEAMTEEQAKTEALRIAQDLKRQIDEGADFAKLAREHSHDPGSAAQGGDLDWFTRDRMVKQFADVAFSLKPGQVSDPVQTQFGYHIIKVEAERLNLPADFEKNKQQYIAQVTERMKQQAWSRYQQELRDAAKIEIADPELRAYKLLDDNPTAGAEEAAQLLTAAIEADPYNYSARYELAMLLDRAGQREQAIAALTELAESEGGAQSPQVRLRLGQMLKEAGKKQEALEHLRAASEWAQGFDYSNYFVHMQLQRLFEELQAKQDASKEKQWMDEFAAQSGGGAPGVINVN